MNDFYTHIYFLIIPMVIGNVVHMIIVKKNLLSDLASPVAKDLFGLNKTYRGFIVLPILVGLSTLFSSYFMGPFGSSLLEDSIIGIVLGIVFLLSELPNSFVKRKVGIASGERSLKYPAIQLFIDRMDSVLGVLLCYYFIRFPSILDVLFLLLLSIVLSYSVAFVLYALKIKKSM